MTTRRSSAYPGERTYRIEFTSDSWDVLTRAHASGEVPSARPYLERMTTKDTGRGLRYVVSCPESVTYNLRDFFVRHEQATGVLVNAALARGQNDPNVAREYAASVHGRNEVEGALGVATRQ